MKQNIQDSITEISYSLYSVAYKFSKDSDVASDIVQDTILKALMNADRYKEGTNLKGWIYTIMRNIFINEYRRKKRYQFMDNSKDFDYTAPEHYHSFNDASSNLGLEEIDNKLNKMEKKHTEPFLMHFQGFKYEEIAEKLRLPIGTVKNRIHLARKELQQHLGANHSYMFN